MNYYNYQDELKTLLDLVDFKQYHRYGQTLYARYETMKPELTICELAWGFCHNPCFATKLHKDLERLIPDRTKFSNALAKSNRRIDAGLLNESFDYAMRQVCSKEAPVMLTYSTESTNKHDRTEIATDDSAAQFLHATDEDGELWHGLLVENGNGDWSNIDIIRVMLKYNGEAVWRHTYCRSEIQRHIRTVNGLQVWTPFKHPVIIFNNGLEVETVVISDFELSQDVKQIFGIGSNEFCEWLSETSFETKLCKNNYINIDMPAKSVTFRIDA